MDIPWVLITWASRDSRGTASAVTRLGVNEGLGGRILLSRLEVLGFKNGQEFLSSQLLNLKQWGRWTEDWGLEGSGSNLGAGLRYSSLH